MGGSTCCDRESYVAKVGVAHTWHNPGQGPLRFCAEFHPAGNMQTFFEKYCSFAAEGRSDEEGQPPILAQCLLMAVLKPVARLRRYRLRYKR